VAVVVDASVAVDGRAANVAALNLPAF
jgi:hypothetical protein